MAACLTEKPWDISDIVQLIEEWEVMELGTTYARAVAVLALAVFPTQILGQPIVCTSPPPNPCGGNSNCVVIDDEWQVTIEPSGQIYLSGRKVSRKELEEYAAAWAKRGTFPIVVSGHTGTKYAQITSIVKMFRKAGVSTRVLCIAPKP